MAAMDTMPSGPHSCLSCAIMSLCFFFSVQFQRFLMWLSVLAACEAGREGQGGAGREGGRERETEEEEV